MQTLALDVIWMLQLVAKGGGIVVPVLENRHMRERFARSSAFEILADANVTFENKRKASLTIHISTASQWDKRMGSPLERGDSESDCATNPSFNEAKEWGLHNGCLGRVSVNRH